MAESCKLSVKHLKAAFLAMEPPDYFISLARQIGGGYLTTEVQISILDLCMTEVDEGVALNSMYVKNVLKKAIVAVETISEDVVDGLYEQFAYHMALHSNDDLKEKTKILKKISFLFPTGYDEAESDRKDLVVPLQCSLNMLEGDTGCALWPSSLFLSEFIFTYPDIFAKKICFEVGSGVGLVGISLIHVGAFKVILTDGDDSSLENMKHNLELNQLSSETKILRRTDVVCKHLQWESPSESEIQTYHPDIVLGADIIYDPLCIPHLIQVLSILLRNGHVSEQRQRNNNLYSETKESPVAYIAQVIRNYETFQCFLGQAEEAHLSVVDITETKMPFNFLPYMVSYDRLSVRLFSVSSSRGCNV